MSTLRVILETACISQWQTLPTFALKLSVNTMSMNRFVLIKMPVFLLGSSVYIVITVFDTFLRKKNSIDRNSLHYSYKE